MKAARLSFSLLLISLLLLGLLPTQALAQFGFDDSQIERYKNMFTFKEGDLTISKEYAFKGETFRIKAFGTVILNEDFDFRTIVDVEYNILGRLRTGGAEIVLGSYILSIGPFTNLKSGTILSYTPLDIPVTFPATAAAGNYDLLLQVTKAKPDEIWQLVQDLIAKGTLEAEWLKTELPVDIRYLGTDMPQVAISVDSPADANAGADFLVNLKVTAPAGVTQVNLSLFQQKAGSTLTLIKTKTVSPIGGSASWTESITAPIFKGELTIIAEVNSFITSGLAVTPLALVRATDTTMINIASPTLAIAVSNPQTVGQDVSYTLQATNPATLPMNVEVYLLPEWEVPDWASAEMAWFFGKVEVVSLLAGGTKNVAESAGPITVQGRYLLKAMCSRFQVSGEWIKASPAILAQALVATTADPVGSLVPSTTSIYPLEKFNLEANILNPGASDITVSYEIKLYVGTSKENVFNATPTDNWKSGTLTIAAGQTGTLSYPNLSADEPQKYLGFKLLVDGALKDQDTVYIKPVSPPSINIIPSTKVADVGQSLNLEVQLGNPMSVPVSFTAQILQRVWTNAGWVETPISSPAVSLAANAKTSVTAAATLPAQPIIVEYGARISAVTISTVNYPVAASNWVRIALKDVVLPDISLSLNPNPVQVGSTLEIRTTVSNSSNKTMVIPLQILLKQPSSTATQWKVDNITVAAGKTASYSYYLSVQPEWQSFGNMKVILKVDSLMWDSTSIPLARPIEVSGTFSIINLELQATLKNKVTGYDLSYDSTNNYLLMSKVNLDSTIVITNMGGWENCPQLPLKLEIITSDGVQMVQTWQTVSNNSYDLIGGNFTSTAKISIVNPTAQNLANVKFVARVTAGTQIQDFTLGVFRIASGSWFLDGSARLLDKVSGSRFASRAWDSDSDGFSDYAEMTRLPNPSNPLDLLDPATAIAGAEKEQRIKELEAYVNSFVSQAGEFVATVNRGGTLLPSGAKAWERMQQVGQTAQQNLDALKALSGLAYTDLTTKVSSLVQQIDNLKTTIDTKYGDSSTPKQAREDAVNAMMAIAVDEWSADPDGDGLSTAQEIALGYDPHKWDSQQPGTSDKDYLANSVAKDMDKQGQDLLGSYVALGQMGNIIADMLQRPLDTQTINNLEEINKTIQEARQSLRNSTYSYFLDFVD